MDRGNAPQFLVIKNADDTDMALKAIGVFMGDSYDQTNAEFINPPMEEIKALPAPDSKKGEIRTLPPAIDAQLFNKVEPGRTFRKKSGSGFRNNMYPHFDRKNIKKSKWYGWGFNRAIQDRSDPLFSLYRSPREDEIIGFLFGANGDRYNKPFNCSLSTTFHIIRLLHMARGRMLRRDLDYFLAENPRAIDGHEKAAISRSIGAANRRMESFRTSAGIPKLIAESGGVVTLAPEFGETMSKYLMEIQ